MTSRRRCRSRLRYPTRTLHDHFLFIFFRYIVLREEAKGWKLSEVGTFYKTRLSPQLNRAEFEDVDDEIRVQYEGFRPGMYIRLEISSIPCEFVTNFDPHYPIILGGLTSSEGNVGYLQVCHLVPELKSVSRVPLL